jgi:hypothetical protein
VAKFCKAVNSELSEVTWGKLLSGRGEIDTRTILIMASELRIPQAELRHILFLKGEKKIAEMVSPGHITPEERYFLDKIRRLSHAHEKIQLVLDLIDALAGDLDRKEP